MEKHKNTIYSVLFILSVVIALSYFAGVAYIYSICALAGLAAAGHLVTLDDDMPGEWSNPEGSSEVWRNSKVALAVKCLVFLILVYVVFAFPSLVKYGAS